jgi:hypothetical protein
MKTVGLYDISIDDSGLMSTTRIMDLGVDDQGRISIVTDPD